MTGTTPEPGSELPRQPAGSADNEANRPLAFPVTVQCAWDGWQTATVQASDLEQLHWRQPEGAPRPLVHGYVKCTQLLAGTIAHACNQASRPHRVLVCVLKSRTLPLTFAQLARLADSGGQMPARDVEEVSGSSHRARTALIASALAAGAALVVLSMLRRRTRFRTQRGRRDRRSARHRRES